MAMWRSVLPALLIAAPALADVKGQGGKVIDCYCTDTQGARVELGETICLFVNGRSFMAQCDMSLNVPSWRDVGEGCLSSKLSPEDTPSATQRMLHILQPAVYPRPVYTPI